MLLRPANKKTTCKDQGGLGARNPNQGIRMFQHGSRSFSRHIAQLEFSSGKIIISTDIIRPLLIPMEYPLGINLHRAFIAGQF